LAVGKTPSKNGQAAQSNQAARPTAEHASLKTEIAGGSDDYVEFR
jgi:hypothetical protein